jgi:multidrug resistance efflux pump
MENQEIDEEVIDSANGENDNEISGEEENNESSAKKNNSNFKALYKSNKEKEALLSQREQELAEAQEELRQWRELNPETVQDLNSKKDIDSMKEEIFTTKNPEAEPHMDEIRKTMLSYNMDLKTAWKFVKMDIPQESSSKKDFNI